MKAGDLSFVSSTRASLYSCATMKDALDGDATIVDIEKGELALIIDVLHPASLESSWFKVLVKNHIGWMLETYLSPAD